MDKQEYDSEVLEHPSFKELKIIMANGNRNRNDSGQVMTGASAGGEVPMDSSVGAHHSIANLTCKSSLSIPEKVVQEMVYWRDIPEDAKVKSVFYDEEKYVTFQPDSGGFNNIRMGFETVVTLAHAMGRTLVLPPEKKMYLLQKGRNKHTGAEQKTQFGFNDFFHMESLAMEHGK